MNGLTPTLFSPSLPCPCQMPSTSRVHQKIQGVGNFIFLPHWWHEPNCWNNNLLLLRSISGKLSCRYREAVNLTYGICIPSDGLVHFGKMPMQNNLRSTTFLFMNLRQEKLINTTGQQLDKAV